MLNPTGKAVLFIDEIHRFNKPINRALEDVESLGKQRYRRAVFAQCILEIRKEPSPIRKTSPIRKKR